MSGTSSSNGSNDDGSTADGTAASDEDFTDYLSTESEAELQREAEVRAAVLAQNRAEELEFKAARQQLAHVDLRPPKSWNPKMIPMPPPLNLSMSERTNAGVVVGRGGGSRRDTSTGRRSWRV